MKDFVRAAKEGGLECNVENITQSCTLVNPGPLSGWLCDQICIRKHTQPADRKSSDILPSLLATVRTLLDVLTS